ncbi:MAG: leucine-rich repeat protein [Bacilli bacterium]|nr:leucine-rich repeat protein [Clostridia bacterium]MBR2240152.1 leucine-rich repeat protein [Clostridia bacterium]MBR4617913.1 leucine-rich repeat protein [Bacilli bacterium]
MSITSQITRIQLNIENAYTAAEAKGATMPVTENSDNLATTIGSISTGITPTGSITLINNGTYNVTNYATAIVNNPNVLKHWYNWKTDATISTTRIIVPSCAYINIKYTKDRYIALDYNQNNKYYYSFDGNNWLEGTFQTSQWWGDVCYGNGIWVALGSGSNFYSVTPYIAVSSDGINWINYAVPSPITESLKRIAFGNGVFVLIGSVSSNQYAFYSTDGINWSQGQNFSSGGGYCDITFGNNFFWTCAGTGTQGPFMNKSSDGINWESVTTPSFNGRRIIYKDNKIFCLAGQDGSRKVYYSLDNGNSWSNFKINDSGQIPSQCGSITYYNSTLFIGTTGLYYTKDLGNTITEVITGYYPTLDTDDINNVVCCCASTGGITSSTTGFYFTVDSLQSYTLDEVPTTLSVVYSAPNTQSSLTVTAGGSAQITLSDTNVYYRNSIDDIQEHLPTGSITITENGTHNVADYSTANVLVEPTIEPLSITPTTSSQTITPTSGVDGYAPLTVSAVDSTIDQNITAGNIKKDVEILGVTGTYTNSKFGINIDNLLGTPVNGVLSTGANTDGDIVFTGVTKLTDFALCAFLINRSNFTHNVSFPDLLSIEGENVLWDAFYKCINIGTVSFPALVNISGDSCFYYAFRACPFTTFTFPELKYIGGTTSVLQYAFYQCTSLTTVSFPKVEEITCPLAFSYCFSNCSSLTDVYFNALTSNSFGSYTNQFSNMLSRCTGVTLHFPSGLQNTISSLSGYPNFGGTDTIVLFDLPATVEHTGGTFPVNDDEEPGEGL